MIYCEDKEKSVFVKCYDCICQKVPEAMEMITDPTIIYQIIQDDEARQKGSY